MTEPALKTSNTWFEDSAKDNFDLHVSGLEVKRYLEVGVCEGVSMIWMIENVNPQVIVGIDAWRFTGRKRHREEHQTILDGYKANFQHNIKPYEDDVDIEIIRELTEMAFPILKVRGEPQFDLIYIDAGHKAYDCLHDMVNAYSLLATGGRMIVDDLNRHFLTQPLVAPAVHQFEYLMHTRLEREWKYGRQICFKKRR